MWSEGGGCGAGWREDVDGGRVAVLGTTMLVRRLAEVTS